MCVVATPTLTHTEIGLQLAAAGVHTLIEKPLAHDPASGAPAGRPSSRGAGWSGASGTSSGTTRRCGPCAARLTRARLGAVFQVATRRQGPFPKRIRDVGVVMDLATHDIDLTQLGDRLAVPQVAAFSAHPSGQHARGPGGGHRDAPGRDDHQPPGQLALPDEGAGHHGDRRTRLLVADTLTAELWFYRNGAITADGPAGPPFRGASEGDVDRYAVAKREPLRVELEHFRDAVLGQAR